MKRTTELPKASFTDSFIFKRMQESFVTHYIQLFQGQEDSERYLTDLGREQADLTGKRLAEMVSVQYIEISL